MYVLCASSYEQGYTGSMAEEGSVYELEGFEKQLGSLLRRFSSNDLRTDSEVFCSDFCKLVEEYVSCCQVPLPRLRVLEVALRCFTRASTFFSSNCDHVLHTLSSLALSVFELLLFFDQKDFHQDPLKQFTITFQECHSVLAKCQNVHLLQVGQLVQGGGPWASSALQAILTESSLPQNGVNGYISSELPVFFELRVRYLLTCERVSEAVALAKCCAWHPTAGQHLFFLQVYLTWLYRTSQHDHLHKEVADLSGKDAVHIICSLETEEKDEFLLALIKAFLSQQLRRGDMYYLWELVFIWSKLHGRLRTSKQALLEESHQLMLSATNVNSIFPFIRVILQELGEEGVQFCVELCANALGSCLPYDVVTKSLIYKTIASLLPNDLEVCRACALLVFFLERTIESYKMVYLLYMHPDQEYHSEHSPVGNHIRFETLQVLKKGLYFDPEFWNLIALRTNCLKLMSEKVASGALEEIMDEKWVPSYCTKESNFCSSTTICQKGKQGSKKRQHKEDRSDMASKRIKVGPGQTRLTVDHTVRKKGPRTMKDTPSEPLRRSFWQLDKIKDNSQFGHGEHRRTTRLSEKNPPKRRIRRPRWLLEDSGTLEGNNIHSKGKRRGMKCQHQKQHQSSIEKRSTSGQDKNDVKHRTSLNSHIKVRGNEDKNQKGFPVDYVKPASPPHVILELSLPDNELLGTFTEETCNRQRGYPQMLFYKPMVKLPPTSQPAKAGHRNEVIVRARDVCTFVQQLHCYARRQKGKGVVQNMRGSVSTITRSSVQGSPPKEPLREVCGKTLAATELAECPVVDKKVPQTQSIDEVSRKTASERELSEKPAFEIKLAIASQTLSAAEVTESPILDKVPQTAEQSSQNATGTGRLHEKLTVPMNVTTASQTPAVAQSQVLDLISRTLTTEDSQITASVGASQTSTVVTDKTIPVSIMAKLSNTEAADPMLSLSQNVDFRNGPSLLERDQESNSLISHSEAGKHSISQNTASNASLLNVTMDHKEATQIVTVAVKDLDITVVTEVLPEGSKRCMSSHDEVKGDTLATNALSKVTKDPGGSVVETSAPEEPDSKDDICDLTLVTEMVTELAPDAIAVNLDCKEGVASEELPTVLESKPNVPCKILTTCSSSVTQQVASADVDVEAKQEEDGTQYVDEDTSEDGEHIEGQQESEESKLEYCCTFCHKTFKGHRVVVHAMFHYRKDECMFCGTLFKDDLLAMMHLSNHIEKLKKSKELADNKAQENQLSGTKIINALKTSDKAKTANPSSAHYNERLRNRSAGCTQSLNIPEPSSSESRKLRSNNKPVDKQISQQKKGNTSKHCTTKATHKVNGHIGTSHINDKKPKPDTMNLNSKQPLTSPEISHQDEANGGGNNFGFLQNGDLHLGPSASPVQLEKELSCSTEDKMKETESLQVLKTTTKQNERVAEENNRQERVYCPVDGCTWSTDPSKNRVALLYHALDDHHGDIGPLQLAFRVGNSRCGVCMRVLWSFEHFQHHVERHRLTPRHPCLHQGCAARFKTGIEMRRHTRKHSPLQALCCLPGCSKLFICLWALNLHEREHYAFKPPKTVKKTIVPIPDKCNNAEVDKKPSHTAVTVNRTLSVKAARKLRRQAADNLSAGKHKEWKKRDESKDSNVLKNLSNKNTSTQPSLPTLRLRQRSRKATKTNTASSQIPTSSLLKPSGKVKTKLKKFQVRLKAKHPKRRAHPPGSAQLIKAVHDENTTADQNDETVRENINVKKDQSGTPARPPTRTPETAQTSAGNELKVEEDEMSNLDLDGVKTTLVALANEQITGVSTPTATAKSLTEVADAIASSEEKTQKLTDKLKKKKRTIPKDKHAQTAPSVSSKAKKHKVTHTKVKKPAKPKSETKTPSDEVGQAKEETANSPLDSFGDAISTATTNDRDENLSPPTAPVEKTKKLKVERSEKPHKKKPTGSSKTKKEHNKIDKKTVKKKCPHKDTDSIKSKSAVQEVEEGNAKEDMPATEKSINEITSAPTSVEKTEKGTTGEKLKKSHTTKGKNSETVSPKPSKAKKHKVADDTKTVKNKHRAPDPSSAPRKPAKKSEIEVPENKAAAEVESSAGEVGKSQEEKPDSSVSGAGYSVMINGRVQDAEEEKPQSVVASEDEKAKPACDEGPPGFRRLSYKRLPPTAYLDEKYTNMPKRRKEMSMFRHSSKRDPLELPASSTAPLQRQRCSSCFVCFCSVEELQTHLQQQTCSSLFGFDSDEEGST